MSGVGVFVYCYREEDDNKKHNSIAIDSTALSTMKNHIKALVKYDMISWSSSLYFSFFSPLSFPLEKNMRKCPLCITVENVMQCHLGSRAC